MPAAASVVRIGTRGSELALQQARQVQRALTDRGAQTEIVSFTTVGDKRLDEPLRSIGAKGLFTEELEAALFAGDVDCCVHSLKDLPTEPARGTVIAAILEREDPRDALVVGSRHAFRGLADIPAGSRVGTSSLRRRALLRSSRPDLEVVELRGNVPTRIRKVDEGQADAAILAAAGLHRLNLGDRIAAYLDAPEWLPAAGQGAIAVQAREKDPRMHGLLAPLNHEHTRIATSAERSCLAALEGGCQVPIGALVSFEREAPVLRAFIADVSGERFVRAVRPVDARDPARAGLEVARDILARGGQEILDGLRRQSVVPAPSAH